MTIVITSDFPSTANPAVINLIQILGPDPQIAWIPPLTDLVTERLPLARQQFGRLGMDHLEHFDIDRDIDRERLKLLANYEVIYLSGGNPIRFRENLGASGVGGALASYSAQDRIVIGASGGAMCQWPPRSPGRWPPEIPVHGHEKSW